MSSTEKRVGRPPGRVKTAKIEILLEPEMKKKFMDILRMQGKNASGEICSWIHEYVNSYEGE